MKKSKKFWRFLLLFMFILCFLALAIFIIKINISEKKTEPEIIKDRNIIDNVEGENKPMRLNGNLTYKVYYGAMDESIINDLLLYNMVIIEPSHITDEDLVKLQDAKVIVIGYQSLLEVGLWDEDILDNLNSEDILIEETEEKGPTADPSSDHYKSIWIEVYEKRIVNRGFDGVFLDTVDHVTLFENDQKDFVMNGTVRFIEDLKIKFPQMRIIQNRGFDVFAQGTASIVDGLMWENFDSTRMNEDTDYANLVKEMDEYSKLFGARILGLNRLHNDENLIFCTENNWLHGYVPSGTYSKYSFDKQPIDWIYNGIIDADWVLTKKQLFVEEGALDVDILKLAQEKDIKMYLIVDVGAVDEQTVIEEGLEDTIIVRKDDSNSNTFILNNNTNTYQQYIMSKIENAKELGYDGILLEGTKNWYDISTNDTPSRIEIYEGYAKFLEIIQDNFPEMKLYQYEGIMTVNSDAAIYLDGFVWTDFANSLYSSSDWQQLQIENLSIIAKEEDWDVYIFSGNKPADVERYCIENGYIYIQ